MITASPEDISTLGAVLRTWRQTPRPSYIVPGLLVVFLQEVSAELQCLRTQSLWNVGENIFKYSHILSVSEYCIELNLIKTFFFPF